MVNKETCDLMTVNDLVVCLNDVIKTVTKVIA